IFITTARGGIHDEAALAQALQSGHLAGAGLDVWDQEPPPLDPPLLALDNVFATFHVAGVTHEGRRNVAAIGAEQIVGLLSGERPPRFINPEVWPEFEKRRARILGGPGLPPFAKLPQEKTPMQRIPSLLRRVLPALALCAAGIA